MTYRLPKLSREEWFLPISIVTALLFLRFGNELFSLLPVPSLLAAIFLWLFGVVLGSAVSVVRQADKLARRLGEPYGTLILTLVITSIEVVAISAVMGHGGPNPTLVRDTLFSVIMIVLNGMVGLSLLVGAWRYREQHFNLQGANSYLGVIVPLATFSLIMPNFTQTTSGPTYSTAQEIVLGMMSVALYAVFVALETGRYRTYFADDSVHETEEHPSAAPGWLSPLILLIVYMVPVIYLVEQLAHPIDYLIETLGAPDPLGGLIMAVLVATPEAIGAARAALANNLQRAVNIFLGSVLSTIGLTVPAMLLVSRLAGYHFVLGLEHTDLVMLILTLAVSVITFASGRTNLLQGTVHLLLFVAYVLLIFEG